MDLTSKKFSVLVYDRTGAFITTFKPEEISALPKWRESINGGFSQTSLDMIGDRFKFDSFGRTTYSQFMNIVRIFEIDEDNTAGRELYRGYIARRTPYLSISRGEGVTLDINHVSAVLPADDYNDGAGPPVFTVTHSAVDPETIFRAIIDNLPFGTPAGLGDLIVYSNDTTDPVGVNVTKTFTDKSHLACLQETVVLAGTDWWWKIDGIGQAWLKAKPVAATHTFTIARDINDLQAPESAEEIVNYVRVRRTGGIESNYSDATSQAAYGFGDPTPTGRWLKILSETSIGDVTTADQRGNKELAENKDPKVKAILEINSLYDIESIHVGETCKILNMDIDNDFFDDNMLIGSVEYDGNTAKVSIIEDPSNFADELDRFVNPS
jgi:hypothetical protein